MSAHSTTTRGWRLSAVGFAALLVGAGVFGGTTAAFAGSDSPTPYTVTSEGVMLPEGMTFVDGGHVNVRTNQGNRGIHFESLNNMPSGAWIGKSFLPWSAFGYDADALCVEWVQVAEFDEHFGEGGQQPVGNGCADPGTTQPGTEEPGRGEPGDGGTGEKPGTQEPGDPGTDDPGTEEPGTDEPGSVDPVDRGTENPDGGTPSDDAETPTDAVDSAPAALPLTDGEPSSAALAASGADALPLVLAGGAAVAALVAGAVLRIAARRRA